MLSGKLRCYVALGLTVSPLKAPLNFRLHRWHSEYHSSPHSVLYLINDEKPLEVFYKPVKIERAYFLTPSIN